VGATIELDKIPTDYDIRYDVSGGEDYELLFTADAAHVESLREALLCETGTELSVIGHITAEEMLVWMENGEPTELNLNGFTHF
jgi:thiamine-monophosphate kinase